MLELYELDREAQREMIRAFREQATPELKAQVIQAARHLIMMFEEVRNKIFLKYCILYLSGRLLSPTGRSA